MSESILPEYCPICGGLTGTHAQEKQIALKIVGHYKRLCPGHSESVPGRSGHKQWVTENLPFVARETKGYMALNEHDTENREMTREEALVAEIKQQRVQIDACFRNARRLAERINRGAGGREVALSITHLQEAKMWLGQALGELGTLLPPEYRDFSEDA